MFNLRVIPVTTFLYVLIAAVTADWAAADELPPALEQAITAPEIPMIVDATITGFNSEGHAEILVNFLYKPVATPGEKTPPPAMIRGYVQDRADGVETIVPMNLITSRGETRFLFFLNGDLLHSTYNNRFEIRLDKEKQLIVNTGRDWKPLKDIVRLIPQTEEKAGLGPNSKCNVTMLKNGGRKSVASRAIARRLTHQRRSKD